VELDEKVGGSRQLSYRTGSRVCTCLLMLLGSRIERKMLPKKVYTFPATSGHYVLTIGRSSSNKLSLDDDRKLSREHAKIESQDGKTYTFYDLGSSRGSKINKVPVTKQVLQNKDIIKIGSTKIKFKVKKTL
jgi:pSer/pThr/pTyr-binding forkhead associated (FHA) protein